MSKTNINQETEESVNSLEEEILFAQKQPIKYLVLSGGGAKGNLYPGMFSALQSSGVMEGVQAIAGSSAGAITAAFIATGIGAPALTTLALGTNLVGLLGDEGVGIIGKDGKPLYDLVDRVIKQSINTFLKSGDLPRNLTSEDRKALDDISNRCADVAGKIFFKDLGLLRSIAPDIFKDLLITAVREDNGELKIFSPETTPDVEIALACRASASIPLVFQPIEIDGVRYVDGGYRDNTPVKYFQEHKDAVALSSNDLSKDAESVKQATKSGRKLVLAFGQGENSDAHIAIYSNRDKITNFSELCRFLIDVVFKTIANVGGNFKYTESQEQQYQNIRSHALEAIVLDPHDVSTLDFAKAQQKAHYLANKGYCQTKRYLANHELDRDPDLNLPYKEFVVQIYEKTNVPAINLPGFKEINDSALKKTEKLLSMADPAKRWPPEDTQKIIKEYIDIAATHRQSIHLSQYTTTLSNIVEVLNKPDTPTEVKQNFLIVLESNCPKFQQKIQAQKLDINNHKAIGQFKFHLQDFDEMIKANDPKSTKVAIAKTPEHTPIRKI